MQNAWFRMFNNYHSIFAPYPRADKSFDIEIQIRVRAFEDDAEKWAAFEAAYPGQSANSFYACAVVEDIDAVPPTMTLWMDLRHYGVKGLWPVHTLGHEFLHALAFARAKQLGETFPPSDLVDADQLTSLENAVPVGDITTYTLGTTPASAAPVASGILDRSKRILGIAADWYSVTVLGATNGPFTISIGGEDHTIFSDVVVNPASDFDYGSCPLGHSVYVYACLSEGVLVYKISNSSSHPFTFTENTSTLLGGFHTFVNNYDEIPPEWQANTGIWHGQWCVPVGATGYSLYKYRSQYQGVTGATEPVWPTTPGASIVDGTATWHCSPMGMNGRYQGNVIPASIWDLTHRARCLNNNGMTYDANTGLWVDIYLSSLSSDKVASIHVGTILLGKRWITAVTLGHVVGKRLLTDHEFQSAAEGCWEETQRYGTSAPTQTGGNTGLFTLTLDAAPTPGDFITGLGSLTGASSGFVCQAVYKVSSTIYLCRNLSNLTGFTDGEIISDGTNSRDCGAGWPQCAASVKGRIVSNIGCEDIVGVYDQWLLDQCFMIVGADYAAAKTFATVDLEDHRGGVYVQSEAKMVAGGVYNSLTNVGALSRKISTGRNTVVSTVGTRYCCEGL
jgi:hypothetical protein